MKHLTTYKLFESLDYINDYVSDILLPLKADKDFSIVQQIQDDRIIVYITKKYGSKSMFMLDEIMDEANHLISQMKMSGHPLTTVKFRHGGWITLFDSQGKSDENFFIGNNEHFICDSFELIFSK